MGEKKGTRRERGREEAKTSCGDNNIEVK